MSHNAEPPPQKPAHHDPDFVHGQLMAMQRAFRALLLHQTPDGQLAVQMALDQLSNQAFPKGVPEPTIEGIAYATKKLLPWKPQ